MGALLAELLVPISDINIIVRNLTDFRTLGMNIISVELSPGGIFQAIMNYTNIVIELGMNSINGRKLSLLLCPRIKVLYLHDSLEVFKFCDALDSWKVCGFH